MLPSTAIHLTKKLAEVQEQLRVMRDELRPIGEDILESTAIEEAAGMAEAISQLQSNLCQVQVDLTALQHALIELQL